MNKPLRILMTWELGAHLGHILELRNLMLLLLERGHSIFLLAPGDVQTSLALPTHDRLTSFPCPSVPLPKDYAPESYAEMLKWCSFPNDAFVNKLVNAWERVIDSVRPDVMLAEHAPVALLMARMHSIPVVHLTTGWGMPPLLSAPAHRPSLPMLKSSGVEAVEAKSGQKAAVLELELTERLNRTLRRRGAPLLTNIHDLYAGASLSLLCTVRELDHFGGRSNTRYVGPLFSLVAELAGKPFTLEAGDDPVLFAQVQGQYTARQKALQDALDQERSLLVKAQSEYRSAGEILSKLQQSLPSYQKTAVAYQQLEKEGFIGNLAAAEKQREALEKSKDLDAQHATVSAVAATIEAQKKRLSQLQSTTNSELQKELAEIRARVEQLRPNLDKTTYREGLMELKAPQAGTVKDLATTTEGAVVQPGSVILTLVPQGEKLFADVAIKNEDIGFVQVGQSAQVKLAAFPFQKYGLLTGKVVRVSADATEGDRSSAPNGQQGQAATVATYKARIALDRQYLESPSKQKLQAGAGMQIAAEIHQGKRSVLEYLLSPVTKSAMEAARER